MHVLPGISKLPNPWECPTPSTSSNGQNCIPWTVHDGKRCDIYGDFCFTVKASRHIFQWQWKQWQLMKNPIHTWTARADSRPSYHLWITSSNGHRQLQYVTWAGEVIFWIISERTRFSQTGQREKRKNSYKVDRKIPGKILFYYPPSL